MFNFIGMWKNNTWVKLLTNNEYFEYLNTYQIFKNNGKFGFPTIFSHTMP